MTVAKVSSVPNPLVKTSLPGATRPRNDAVVSVDAGVDDRHGAVLALVGDAQAPQVVQADERAGRRAGQAPTVLNCQMPSLSEAYSVVPSAENEMLRLDSMKLCGPWLPEVLKPRAKSVIDPLPSGHSVDPDDPAADVAPAGRVAVGEDRDDCPLSSSSPRPARALDGDQDRVGGQGVAGGDRRAVEAGGQVGHEEAAGEDRRGGGRPPSSMGNP